MDKALLKRKLRQLKKFEVRTRFRGDIAPENTELVWDALFSTREEAKAEVRYPFCDLLKMDKDGLKQAFDIFFSIVYYRFYEENGIAFPETYDVGLLDILELPFDSSTEDIKKKFRSLAKLHHPDMGGDSRKFIRLMEVYRTLLGGK